MKKMNASISSHTKQLPVQQERAGWAAQVPKFITVSINLYQSECALNTQWSTAI